MPRARVTHTCHLCERPILAGCEYVAVKIYPGDADYDGPMPFTVRCHLPCDTQARRAGADEWVHWLEEAL